MTSNQIKWRTAQMENQRELNKLFGDYGLVVDPETGKTIAQSRDSGVKTKDVDTQEQLRRAQVKSAIASAKYGSDPISGLVKTLLGWGL